MRRDANKYEPTSTRIDAFVHVNVSVSTLACRHSDSRFYTVQFVGQSKGAHGRNESGTQIDRRRPRLGANKLSAATMTAIATSVHCVRVFRVCVSRRRCLSLARAPAPGLHCFSLLPSPPPPPPPPSPPLLPSFCININKQAAEAAAVNTLETKHTCDSPIARQTSDEKIAPNSQLLLLLLSFSIFHAKRDSFSFSFPPRSLNE